MLSRLKEVKVVDPACGSGAYLLGMLHELFELMELLEVRVNSLSAKDRHKRKLSIIRNNLYGIDKDEFAVNIARLRLWLSLAVEYEGDRPEPLPNLDFKVLTGDSLSAPDPQGGPQPDLFRQQQIEEFKFKKECYDDPYYVGNKIALKQEIKAIRDEIREWSHPGQNINGFDWRVEFVEVFNPQEPTITIAGTMDIHQGELVEQKRPGGFDVVLANPPYVRQKDIGANKPLLEKQYKEAVQGNSDLFCYFYARGLQLLRPGGVHVYVCSNSWLDVDYGGKLQGYLLEKAHVQVIYDSAVERQFATADINTIISVIQKGKPAKTVQTRFVSLHAPFEQAITNSTLRREIVRTHDQLWQSGLGDPDKKGIRHYEGDKWGGKYLRAPDVFWKILERGGDKLIRLGDIAKVARGYTTGANDFFYVRVLNVNDGIATIRCDDESLHTIEAEYVREPALVKAREIVRPHVTAADLQYVLVCLDESAAKKPHATAYIKWGEEQGFHLRPTTKNRKPWYVIKTQDYAVVAFPMAHKRRAVIGAMYDASIHVDNRFYGVYPHDPGTGMVLANSLVSTFSTLCREVYGRANFGQGMLDMKVYEAADLPVLNPAKSTDTTALSNAFATLAERGILLLYSDVRQPDRKALDDAFLLAVGFTDAKERADTLAELHDAACRSVWKRQAKAENTPESRQTYDAWLASENSLMEGLLVEEE